MSSTKSTINDEEDEIEDYMSNDFLEKIVDTRPGLVFNRSVARKYDKEKKKEEIDSKNKQLPVKLLEKKHLEEGLKKSTLNSENKGFNLMLKMGYKAGQSLGKETESGGTTSNKLIEPIPIQIKSDREGLGVAEERKRKLIEIEEMRKKLNEKKQESEKDKEKNYLDSKRSKFQLRKTYYNLNKCQRICFQLDSTERNLKYPEVKFYWPKSILRSLNKNTVKAETLIEKKENQVQQDTSDEKKVDQIETCAEKSEFKTEQIEFDSSRVDLKLVYEQRLENFLKTDESSKNNQESRTNNETEKEDKEDEEEENNEDIALEKNQDYYNLVAKEKAKSGDDIYDLSEEEEEEDEYESEELINKKIDAICLYLREKYIYCVWCASKYDSESDLINNCPGLTEKDHEEVD